MKEGGTNINQNYENLEIRWQRSGKNFKWKKKMTSKLVRLQDEYIQKVIFKRKTGTFLK